MAFGQRTPEQLADDAAERRHKELVGAIRQLERTTMRLPLYFMAWSIIVGIIGGLLYVLLFGHSD